ncbi:hypothetical protein P5673_023743 [Acropora cervicornis]|uniref:Uncharacterized protein n=1 Tax=Acropora cervicornis TaxID=6130 RepID=A0AAD9Q4V8_ACRCE|nr:hypothetical protein P5673_023743 [Acropora cervicornis]
MYVTQHIGKIVEWYSPSFIIKGERKVTGKVSSTYINPLSQHIGFQLSEISAMKLMWCHHSFVSDQIDMEYLKKIRHTTAMITIVMGYIITVAIGCIKLITVAMGYISNVIIREIKLIAVAMGYTSNVIIR